MKSAKKILLFLVIILPPLLYHAWEKDFEIFGYNLSRMTDSIVQPFVHNYLISTYKNKVTTNADLIVKMREIVFFNTTPGRDDFCSHCESVEMLRILKKKKSMSCGGMAFAYVAFLKAFGIPSRIVQLGAESFLSGKDQGDTHMTVEVYDPETKELYLSDPLFNSSFTCGENSEKLSAEKFYYCVQRNEKVNFNVSHRHPLESANIESYYLPFEKLGAAVFTYAFSINNEATAAIPKVSLPDSRWIEEATKKYR